jgi:hypothetical protein
VASEEKKEDWPQRHRDTEIGDSDEAEKKELTQSSLRLDTEVTEKSGRQARTDSQKWLSY